MKIILRNNNGAEIEVEKINCLSEGDLILKSRMRIHDEQKRKIEDYYTEKFNRRVIVLDGMIDEIFTIPPLKSLIGCSQEDREGTPSFTDEKIT